jgi:allantoicase
MHAKGSFDVNITPQESAPDAPVARMRLYKEFHGDLEAVAHGEMTAAHEPLTGAGVYVAIDRVTGTLHGKSGSFLIAHRGIRNADGQELSIVIVPGSGTGQLTGITGSVGIEILEKKHFYTMDYELP